MFNEKAKIVTKQFIKCPYCGKYESGIDHLINRDTTAGPWYCDVCGKSWSMKFHENGDIDIIQNKNTKQDMLVALRYNNLYILVKGMAFDNKHNHEYFYNENTCPENYFRATEVVIDMDNNDTDPHGLFEYLATVPYPKDTDVGDMGIKELENLFSVKMLSD